MKIAIDNPEPTMILRLSKRINAIVLVADLGDGHEQDMIVFTSEGIPTADDPLGQNGDVLIARTLKLRADFPVRATSNGHLAVTEKA